MQVAVENLGQLQRRLTISIPAKQIEDEIELRLKKKANTAKLKGFRPGKVPLPVMRQHFGDAIRDEVLGDLIRSSFYEALQKEKLHIAGLPRIEPKPATAADAPFEYQATFEIYPQIEFKDLAGVKINKVTAKVTDVDLSKVLNKLRDQYAEWVEVDRPAKNGDRVMVDFVGTIDGEKFEGGSAENIAVVLGSKSMISGFEEGLVGAKAGDSLTLDTKFPKDYPKQELADKQAQFATKVNKVLEPKLPELDDEFAKRLDIAGGIDALRAEVRKSMERELERATKEGVKKQVFKALLERNPITVPESLINAEIDQMQQQLKQRFAAQTGQKNLPDLPRENFTEQAKERVTIGLLLSEYIKDQQIKADNSRTKNILEELAASYDNPEQIVNYYLQNKQALAQIESLVLEEQAVEKLMAGAEVEEKSVSYDEIVNPDNK